MNLFQLYKETPVARHQDIKVAGDKVYIKDAEGNCAEYLLEANDELWLIRSDKKLKADIEHMIRRTPTR